MSSGFDWDFFLSSLLICPPSLSLHPSGLLNLPFFCSLSLIDTNINTSTLQPTSHLSLLVCRSFPRQLSPLALSLSLNIMIQWHLSFHFSVMPKTQAHTHRGDMEGCTKYWEVFFNLQSMRYNEQRLWHRLSWGQRSGGVTVSLHSWGQTSLTDSCCPSRLHALNHRSEQLKRFKGITSLSLTGTQTHWHILHKAFLTGMLPCSILSLCLAADKLTSSPLPCPRHLLTLFTGEVRGQRPVSLPDGALLAAGTTPVKRTDTVQPRCL